jgi:heme-degrading monooxygenase HmoA
MFYAVTNHLFPKDSAVDQFVINFADNNRPAITERWNAPRFEMRRPAEGDEWLSVSIWPSTEAFDAWRSSQDIQTSHRNASSDNFSRRALLSFHDIVMNAAPGRPPVAGQPERYPAFGIDTPIVLRRFVVAEGHEDDVIRAFADLPAPDSPGWLWWDLWKLVRGEDWWSVSYFEDGAALGSARTNGYPYLQEPGDPAWYPKPATESVYFVEIERIPGMSEFAWKPRAVPSPA